jgi:hypothetical protein
MQGVKEYHNAPPYNASPFATLLRCPALLRVALPLCVIVAMHRHCSFAVVLCRCGAAAATTNITNITTILLLHHIYVDNML